MSIARKYIGKSIFSQEVADLFNFFHKVYYDNSLLYQCKSSDEVDMMEYFCSVGFAKKVNDNEYELEENCSIVNSFMVLLNCLTNKLSMPYTSFSSSEEFNSTQAFNARVAFQEGMMHGDFSFNQIHEFPFVLGIFNENIYDKEPLFLHFGFFEEIKNIEEAFLKLSDIKNSMPKEARDNHYVVYDRQHNTLIFETRDSMKLFSKLFPFWGPISKTYYYQNKKAMADADVQSFMNNPTKEGAQKIIESLKADLQNKFPDVDINIRIEPIGEAEPESSEPTDIENDKKEEVGIEPENIKFNELNKHDYFSVVHPNTGSATIYKDNKPYCILFLSAQEGSDEYFEEIRAFIDKLNG